MYSIEVSAIFCEKSEDSYIKLKRKKQRFRFGSVWVEIRNENLDESSEIWVKWLKIFLYALWDLVWQSGEKLKRNWEIKISPNRRLLCFWPLYFLFSRNMKMKENEVVKDMFGSCVRRMIFLNWQRAHFASFFIA